MDQQVTIRINGFPEFKMHLQKNGTDAIFLMTSQRLAGHNDFLFAHHYIKKTLDVYLNEIAVCLAAFLESGASVILAVGGGSIIDLAKSVMLRCIEQSLPTPVLAVVPTTAGSGSEATSFAVVYDGKKKLSLQHPGLLPSLVLLDAGLTLTLSSRNTAISGIDAFAQAIESFWNINATEESRRYASEAITLLRDWLPVAINDPSINIREKILLAAHLAGKAINITKTTGPHALSYYLTAHHGVPHGQAVALFLPLFFIYNNENTGLNDLLNVTGKEEASLFVRGIIKNLGLATTLHELTIDSEEIWDELLSEVNQERFKNNPVAFDKPRLKELCRRLL